MRFLVAEIDHLQRNWTVGRPPEIPPDWSFWGFWLLNWYDFRIRYGRARFR